MKDSKTIKLLTTFDKTEFTDLGKFISSPFFSKGRDLISIYNELKPFHPDYDDPKLTRELIFNKLYPGKKFGDTKSNGLMRTLMSELLKLSKEYLIYIEMRKDENRRKVYTLKQLRERKLYKEFEKEYSSAIKEVGDLKEIGVDSFHDLYNNVAQYTGYCIETGKIQGVFNSLLLGAEYSMMHALIRSYANLDHKISAKAFNVDYKENFTDILLENLDSEKMLIAMKKRKDKLLPYLEVYYMVHMMSKHPDKEEYYFNLKSLLRKHIHLFVHSQKYTLYSMLSSYCVRKSVYENNSRFVMEEFDIIATSLDLGIHKHSSQDDFQVNNFRNIMLTALDLNKTDWLENFILRYSPELNPNHRENMKYYALAHLYFAKKEYEKALAHLIEVQYDYFLFQMDIKFLMFRIYYEMNLTEQAFSILSTITQYFKTTKDLSDAFKIRGQQFVKFTRELLRRKSDHNLKDIDYFYKKVESASDVNSRLWILEKINEI